MQIFLITLVGACRTCDCHRNATLEQGFGQLVSICCPAVERERLPAMTWSRINPCVHRQWWLCVRSDIRHPLRLHCPVFRIRVNAILVIVWVSLIVTALCVFDAGVWNETSEFISIQFPLPNDIDSVKLYCIPWYVDFEARTNLDARR